MKSVQVSPGRTLLRADRLVQFQSDIFRGPKVLTPGRVKVDADRAGSTDKPVRARFAADIHADGALPGHDR
jgi:hypothetical protein